MKSKSALLFLVLWSSFGQADAANNFASKRLVPSAPLVAADPGIPVGEDLVYDVFWMGVQVGIGTLSVKEKVRLNGRDAYHVLAVAETNEFLSKIYPVRDEVHSWIDAETFQSLRFRKIVSEGRYRADELTVYDADKKTGVYESLKNGSRKEFGIHVPVHDIISAFFWARRQTLSVGRSFKTIVNSDEKDWDLEVDVLRREAKELRGQGVLDTVLIEPKTRLKGVLEKRGRVWIHLKNDAFRTPIWISFKTPFGPVLGVIRQEKAARHV